MYNIHIHGVNCDITDTIFFLFSTDLAYTVISLSVRIHFLDEETTSVLRS